MKRWFGGVAGLACLATNGPHREVHRTGAPALLGTDATHGCVRLSNEDIAMLAARLPLGTPVEVLDEALVTAPLDLLDALAVQEIDLAPDVRHVEVYTMGGLLTILWHGARDAERIVVACGGAMGGLLGPSGGLYQRLGETLAGHGVGTLRVSYRKANDLDRCTIDLCAAVDLAARAGARRSITMGHSFGGAIAVRTACALGDAVAGVVTFATQSAGCEQADELGGRPLLLFHGDRDELLPVQASELVRFIAGTGELVVLPGEGHLMSGAGDLLLDRVCTFVTDVLPA